MTLQEIKAWNNLSPEAQNTLFKSAREKLGMTQTALGHRLVDYGYAGGLSTVRSWENSPRKIPVLVYELVLDGFERHN